MQEESEKRSLQLRIEKAISTGAYSLALALLKQYESLFPNDGIDARGLRQEIYTRLAEEYSRMHLEMIQRGDPLAESARKLALEYAQEAGSDVYKRIWEELETFQEN